MSASKYPKSAMPKAKLSEFLVGDELEEATGGLISEQAFQEKREKLTSRRPDGSQKRTFEQMEQDEKLNFLYVTGQQTQRDMLQNSIRLYGIKKNDAHGDSPTDILKRVCKEGLKLDSDKYNDIATTALRFIQRVEGGKCIVFQLNRVDLVKKIFENIGNLKDYENPWNKAVKIAITRNLCPEDNRIRSECLSVKELLHEKGFKDVKIRFNKIISVNGGEWHEYSWYLEHKYEDALAREEQAKASDKKDTEAVVESGGKRKGKRRKRDETEESTASSSESEGQQGSSKSKKSKEWPALAQRKDQRPGSGKKSKK